MDDLKGRRNTRKAANAIGDLEEATFNSQAVIDFSDWLLANMPSLSPHVNGLVGCMIGSIIGAWFDAGATPDLMKEYFARFVDMVWAGYKEAQKQSPG